MITLIVGRQGSGKTLLIVKLAWEYYKQGKKIYSNIKLKFRFYKLNYNDIVNCVLSNAVIILDEIHLLLSNRECMRKANIEITNGFLGMIRKKNVELIGSLQTLRKCDIKVREECDYIIEVNKYARINDVWNEVLHNQDLGIDVPIMIKGVMREMYHNSEKEFYFIGNPYFNLYDSKEIIKIEGLET
jgi:hypothetical protein